MRAHVLVSECMANAWAPCSNSLCGLMLLRSRLLGRAVPTHNRTGHGASCPQPAAPGRTWAGGNRLQYSLIVLCCAVQQGECTAEQGVCRPGLHSSAAAAAQVCDLKASRLTPLGQRGVASSQREGEQQAVAPNQVEWWWSQLQKVWPNQHPEKQGE